jgi:hypothetical protein
MLMMTPFPARHGWSAWQITRRGSQVEDLVEMGIQFRQ